MSSATPAPPPSFLPGPATRQPCSYPALVGLALRRPAARRSITALAATLAVAAGAMFAYPAVTDLVGRHDQVHVAARFNDPGFKAAYRKGHVPVGQGLTRLIIDNSRVQVSVMVVQGTTVAALQAGAGHYTTTPYPCGAAGNVAIAGHRTTYGRPFNRINEMRPGDTVTLVTPVSRCVYRVVPGFDGHSNPWIVLPNDVSVVSQTGDLASGHWLTLTSCNPPGSASQRIVLRAEMVSCKGSSCQSAGSIA